MRQRVDVCNVNVDMTYPTDNFRRGLDDAIRMAGGQAALARSLGIDRSNINRWIQRGTVPARQAIAIHRMHGIPAHMLCPAAAVVA